MKSHGLLFTAEMIRAQLDGRKTQARHLVTTANSYIDGIGGRSSSGKNLWDRLEWSRARASEDAPYWMVPRKGSLIQFHQITPRIKPGDGYWLRETFLPRASGTLYRSDYDGIEAGVGGLSGGWKSPIFMRRSESRITGIIPQVRAQFVQDISEADARAEGAAPVECSKESIILGTWKARFRYRDGFRLLWDSINTEPGTRWEDNPPLWAYTLERKVS